MINQVLAGLAVAVLLILAGPSGLRAHEIRPAITDLVFAGDGTVRLDMSLILEAALAEIGAEHADTDESPNAGRYDDLRRLDESGFAAEFERFTPRFLQGVRLSADGADVPLEVAALGIAIAAITNGVVKSAIAFAIGGRTIGWYVLAGLLGPIAAGVAAYLLLS